MLIENHTVSIEFQALHSKIGSRDELDHSIDQKTADALLAKRVKERASELTLALMGAAPLREARIRKLADASRRALGAKESEALLAIHDLPTPEVPAQKPDLSELLVRGAALSLNKHFANQPTHTRLAEACKLRLWGNNAPGGSAWATSSGCGLEALGHPDEDWGVDCGMGFFPETSRRFLLFYVPVKKDWDAQETQPESKGH